jgi:DNA topoisomerase-1
VARYLDADAARLYELIWKRAVASQMESAQQERTTVDVMSADKKITLARHRHRHPVRRLLDPLSGRPGRQFRRGWLQAAGSGGGRYDQIESINPAQHFTEPPPRYSEASLVKKWKSWASAAPPPMPRSSRPCATVPM